MKSLNPVISFEIPVNDLQRASDFYQVVFNLDIRFAKFVKTKEPNIGIIPAKLDNHGIGGSLIVTDESIIHQRGVLIYFHATDISQTLEKVIENKGKIISNNLSIAIIEDTEGNQIGIQELNNNDY